jgi:hypothetical protein
MTQSVFVVEEGCYSDRHIVAIFSTREAADAYVATFSRGPHEDWCKTEHQLDAESPPVGMRSFEVRFFGDSADAHLLGDPPEGGVMGPYMNGRSDYDPALHVRRYYPTIDDLKELRIQCWARDADHAIEIASDRRAALIRRRAEKE